MPQAVGLGAALEAVSETSRSSIGARGHTGSQPLTIPNGAHEAVSEQEEESEQMDDSNEDERLSPRSALEAYNDRLNMARIRAEFESTLMTVLTLNVLYMYYVDHKLIILFVRAIQVVRLLQFPYASETTQWSTGLLVLFSNIVVILIHVAVLLSNEPLGRMLFINFIGPEPKSPFKTFFLDVLIFLLEVLLVRCRLSPDQVQLRAVSPSTSASLDEVDVSDEDRPVEQT